MAPPLVARILTPRSGREPRAVTHSRLPQIRTCLIRASDFVSHTLKSVSWSAARQTTVRSARGNLIAAPVSEKPDGLRRWHAMGIAWPGQAARSGRAAFRGARRGRRRVVQTVFGERREAAAAEERLGTGLRASEGTQVGIALDGAGRAAGVVGRRQRQSRGVLGHRELGAGLEGIHSEHEPVAADRALTQ